MAATDRMMSAPLKSRMTPTDALFWYAEEATPALRPLIGGLFLLDQSPDPEKLQRSIARWMARMPRLRQRVVEGPLRLSLPEWQDDPQFDLAYHTREIVLPEQGTLRNLFEFTSAVFATPLDHARPLWESYLIHGVDNHRSAVFIKMHHCVMDGVSSMAAFDAITQLHRADPITVPRGARIGTSDSEMARIGRLLWNSAEAMVQFGGTIAQVGIGIATNPIRTTRDLISVSQSLAGVIRDLGKPPLADPLSQLSTGIGRRLDGITWSLRRLHRIKGLLDVTLNDLVLTVLAGALGQYYAERGFHASELRCMVPISLRAPHEKHSLGNRIGMCNITLPIGEPHPLVRLELIRNRTGRAKSDRRGRAYPMVIGALALMPTAMFRVFAQTATSRLNLICTNIPGPREARYIAGAKVDAIFPYAPVVQGTPLAIGLVSYGDSYGIGINTDPAAIPDPERLHVLLDHSLIDLERRVLPHSELKEKPTSGGKAKRSARPAGTSPRSDPKSVAPRRRSIRK